MQRTKASLPLIGQVAAGEAYFGSRTICRNALPSWPGMFKIQADFLLRVNGESI